MKHFLIFLLGVILLTGCSTDEEPKPIPPAGVTSEISIGATRTQPDSIAIALENSALLQDLNAYNDSILATCIEPQLSFGWLKNLARVAKADFYGFAVGMVLGSSLTTSPVVGAVCGVVVGASYSAATSQKYHPTQTIRKLPATFESQIVAFDRYTYEMSVDNNFEQKYNVELNSVGDLSSYGDFSRYLKYGVEHNLAVNQFRNGPSLNATTIN